ncbi:hypothetical protein TNCV_1194601 [Trichonephila clavipes]|nr:hypothetical protein TNCV_1194601 [Trichonephila clavipes]
MSSNTRCSGLSRQRKGYSTSRMATRPARSSDLNPIENVWDALGRQVAESKLSSDKKQEHPHPCTHRVNGINCPQQLPDNVVAKYVVRRVWNVASHSTWWTYPVLMPFFPKVPA